MVGTSGAMRAVSEGVSESGQMTIPEGLWCYRVDRRRFVLGGALSNGGGVFAWMERNLALPSAEQTEKELAGMAPGAHGLTVLPLFAGERSTKWRADARAAITGMSIHTSPVEILRASLESVALRFRNIYDIMEQQLGAPIEVIGVRRRAAALAGVDPDDGRRAGAAGDPVHRKRGNRPRRRAAGTRAFGGHRERARSAGAHGRGVPAGGRAQGNLRSRAGRAAPALFQIVRGGVNRVTPEVMQLASKIRLLLMDVDGVLTDGRLYNVPDAAGNMVETKGFDSQDGISLQWMNWKGIVTGLISGRVSPATVERAKQCKFRYVYQGHIEKIPILEEILADAKLVGEQVAYIGDDLTDVVVMRRVGLAVATANARAEVKAKGAFRDGGRWRQRSGARGGGGDFEGAGVLGGNFTKVRGMSIMALAGKQTTWLFMGAAALVYTAVFFVSRGQRGLGPS